MSELACDEVEGVAAATVTTLSNGIFCTCLTNSVWHTYNRCFRDTSESAVPILVESTSVALNINDARTVSLLEEVDVETATALCSDQALRALQHSDKLLYHSFLYSSSDRLSASLLHASVLEAVLMGLVRAHAPTVMLLKDALAHEVLACRVPSCLLRLCRFVMLPTGLNLRNVLWHGFLAPTEVDPRAPALLLCLHRTLTALPRSHPQPAPGLGTSTGTTTGIAQELGSFEGFVSVFEPLVDLAECVLPGGCAGCPAWLARATALSQFVCPGREELLCAAFADFAAGRYLSALVQAFPCVEHGLRLLFCVHNRAPCCVLADSEAYFSTLDGFGQRSKHQLLLDGDVFVYPQGGAGASVSRPSLLPGALGPGLYGLLVDLFFSEAGPNVRALVAHGEVSLSLSVGAESRPGLGLPGGDQVACCAAVPEGSNAAAGLHAVTAAVMVAAVALVARFPRPAPQSVLSTITTLSTTNRSIGDRVSSPDRLYELLETVNSREALFHAQCVLARQLERTHRAISRCTATLATRPLTVSGSRAPPGSQHTVKLESDAFESQVRVGTTVGCAPVATVWESHHRLGQLLSPGCLLADTNQIGGTNMPVRGQHVRSLGAVSAEVMSCCRDLVGLLREDGAAGGEGSGELELIDSLIRSLDGLRKASVEEQAAESTSRVAHLSRIIDKHLGVFSRRPPLVGSLIRIAQVSLVCSSV